MKWPSPPSATFPSRTALASTDVEATVKESRLVREAGLQRQSLVDLLTERLLGVIVRDKLEEGDVVPSTAELAAQTKPSPKHSAVPS